MSAKEPRSVEVGFSTAQLDSAGITDDINDSALWDIVDDFMRSNSDLLAVFVQEWVDDHHDELEFDRGVQMAQRGNR